MAPWPPSYCDVLSRLHSSAVCGRLQPGPMESPRSVAVGAMRCQNPFKIFKLQLGVFLKQMDAS